MLALAVAAWLTGQPIAANEPDIEELNGPLAEFAISACPGASQVGLTPKPRQSETPETLRQRLWDERQQAQAVCAFSAVPLWTDHDLTKARKLFLIGMLRSRYEHSLCKSWPANEASGLYTALRSMAGSELGKVDQPSADEGAALINEVMDWPGLLEYQPTMLEPLCSESGGVRPRDEWDQVAQDILKTPRSSGSDN